MNRISKIFRNINTLRNLKSRQVFGRLYSRIKLKYNLLFIPNIPTGIRGKLSSKKPFNEKDPWNTRESILTGRFIFSNEENNIGFPPDWDSDKMSDACMLHIHFFNFLFLLSNDEKVEICKSWIRSNPPSKREAWMPYGVSLRIFSWMRANLNNEIIDNSIYKQASFLYRNTEYYIPANHYLENGRALLFAGVYFKFQGESAKWYNKGFKILVDALDAQFYKDGVHYEKSIMYHNIALQIYADVLNLLPEEDKCYKQISNEVNKMADFLKSALHPDGNIALLSDSSLEMGNPPQQILDYVFSLTNYKASCKFEFKDSGHFIFKNENIYFILDAGEIASPIMAGHAHADIFSFELSYLKRRFIVDTGTGTYTKSKQRDFVRSTQAHNTVSIDKQNQAELWDSFRVGRMFKPKKISFEYNNNSFNFSGIFDGYSKLIGDNLVHKRDITYMDECLEVTDLITGDNIHLCESFIHLSPDCKLNLDDKLLKIYFENQILTLQIVAGLVSIKDSFYYPEMGSKLANKTVVIYSESILPSKLKYIIKL